MRNKLLHYFITLTNKNTFDLFTPSCAWRHRSANGDWYGLKKHRWSAKMTGHDMKTAIIWFEISVER